MEAIVILSGVLLIVALISLLYVESCNQTLKTKLDVAEDKVKFLGERLHQAGLIIGLHEKEHVYYDRVTNELFTSPMTNRPNVVIIGEL